MLKLFPQHSLQHSDALIIHCSCQQRWVTIFVSPTIYQVSSMTRLHLYKCTSTHSVDMCRTFKYVSLPSLIPIKLSRVSSVQEKTNNSGCRSSLDLIRRSVTPTILPRTCFHVFVDTLLTLIFPFFSSLNIPWRSYSIYPVAMVAMLLSTVVATVALHLHRVLRSTWCLCLIVQTLQQSVSLVKNDPILCLSATPSLHLLYITHQLNIFFILIFIINGIIRFGVYFNEQINHWIKHEIGTECVMSFMSL